VEVIVALVAAELVGQVGAAFLGHEDE
jgi:hypothetical protein